MQHLIQRPYHTSKKTNCARDFVCLELIVRKLLFLKIKLILIHDSGYHLLKIFIRNRFVVTEISAIDQSNALNFFH